MTTYSPVTGDVHNDARERALEAMVERGWIEVGQTARMRQALVFGEHYQRWVRDSVDAMWHALSKYDIVAAEHHAKHAVRRVFG